VGLSWVARGATGAGWAHLDHPSAWVGSQRGGAGPRSCWSRDLSFAAIEVVVFALGDPIVVVVAAVAAAAVVVAVAAAVVVAVTAEIFAA